MNTHVRLLSSTEIDARRDRIRNAAAAIVERDQLRAEVDALKKALVVATADAHTACAEAAKIKSEWAALHGTPMMTGLDICREIAKKHGFSMLQMRSRRRSAELVAARDEAIHRLDQETRLSSKEMGRILDRDHTSILHSLSKPSQAADAWWTPERDGAIRALNAGQIDWQEAFRLTGRSVTSIRQRAKCLGITLYSIGSRRPFNPEEDALLMTGRFRSRDVMALLPQRSLLSILSRRRKLLARAALGGSP